VTAPTPDADKPATPSTNPPPARREEGAPPASSVPTSGPEPQADEYDPITLATLALQRLRRRASTDFAELRVQYQRLDGIVLVIASLIVFGAGFLHRWLVEPQRVTFAERGLRFERTTAWLSPDPVPPIAPRLVRDPNPARNDGDEPYHVAFNSSLAPARFEVFIDQQPMWSNIVTGLELDRRTRWGEAYAADPSVVRSIAGHDWLRTAYRFAHAEKGDEPVLGNAVEYAAVDREQLYVVTLFGDAEHIARMESVIVPTLRVESRTGLPLLPQVGRLARREFPAAVGSAFQSTVMVVVADLVNGRLRARGGGSGIVIGGDGSILTNFHVLHDREGRLHDVFVIGRFVGPDRSPALVCAGRPSRSKLQRELDLALIKCDTDLDGRAWTPARWGLWPTIPAQRLDEIIQGERLWVLGYPDVGGGGLTLSQGSVEGLTGEDNTIGRDYIKTDASITHGNSGGPVVDDAGRLIGIATAFRIKVSASGGVIETQKHGLVRPLASASDLLAIATAGWTPREGRTAVELEPTAVDAPAEGVRISTKILDAANKAPVGGALLLVLRPGINTGDIDMNRLDEMVLAWGRSNAYGEVHLKQPVPAPGTYTVMVVAKGFGPLIGDGVLKLDGNTPAFFDPWGEIVIDRK
jgi:S1-C subfamily serine protease